jgi:hypothetical protein
MRQGIVAVGFTYSSQAPQLPDLTIELEIAADDLPLAKSTLKVSWKSIFEIVAAT